MVELPPALPPTPGPDGLVVHATLRGPVLGIAGSLALLALGGGALAQGGPRPFTLVLLAAGVGLGLVSVLDLPRRSEIGTDGITRVCLLRRHLLPWDTLAAIERARPARATVLRNTLDRREGRERHVSGGLVARGRGNKRRWLLTDQVESRDEHDRLVALVARLQPTLRVRAPRPHASASPTDLYRRHR